MCHQAGTAGGRGGHRHGRSLPPWLSSSSSSSTIVQRRCHCRRRCRPRHGPPVHRAPPPIAITVVVDCYLVPLSSPPSTDRWQPNKGGRDCENKAKFSKKKGGEREYSRHKENTTMVTYLKAVSFGLVSLFSFIMPARFFILLPVQVVEMRSVMVEWFLHTVCHQICTH